LVALTLTVGLFAAVGTAHAIPGTTTRVAGLDRYETAVEISQRIAPTSSHVVITTGQNFADALAAGPYATSVGAPVLLVRQGTIPPVTLAEVQRLAPSVIWVIGGPAAVSDAVLQQLEALAVNDVVIRLWGADRYATSLEVIDTMSSISYLTIVTGRTFQDAVIGGALAAREGGALMLIHGTQPLTPEQVAMIQQVAPFAIRVIGTTASISDAVYDQIDTVSGGVGIQRIGDADVHQRAITMWQQTLTASGNVAFATSENWPDALVAAPLVAKENRILLLAPGTCIPQVVGNLLDISIPTSNLLIGGPAALSAAVEAETICS
jgi:putative cell wall-binding protein